MYKIKEEPKDFIVNEIMDLKLDSAGRYSYFKLKKESYNTEEAMQKISETLNIQQKKINYSGAKDRVAITTQYISIQDLTALKRKDISIKDIDLRYIGQGNEPLSLGSHEENEFIITVKDAKKSPRQDFEINKVPNLFGPQRFSKNNHIVGKHLIRKEFKKAIEAILENHGKHEDKIRDYLLNNDTDFIGALRTVPKKILSLYIHAYQSLMYNDMVEMLIKTKPDTENIKLPLIGFSTDSNKYPDYIVDDILDKEEIDARDFIIKQIPDLSSEGDEREIYMKIKDYSCKKTGDNTYEVRFILGKGSYATVFIDYLFG